jgi:hypothetical protein
VCRNFGQEFRLFLLPPKKARLWVNLYFGRSYAPEKSALTHPFKLKELAKLCAGSGEVMVFLTFVHEALERPGARILSCRLLFPDVVFFRLGCW